MKPVYVVGYGMIDSLGNNPKDCFDKMLDNHDYSSDLPELKAENAKVLDYTGSPKNVIYGRRLEDFYQTF